MDGEILPGRTYIVDYHGLRRRARAVESQGADTWRCEWIDFIVGRTVFLDTRAFLEEYHDT